MARCATSSPLQQSHCLRVFQRGVVRVTGWSGGCPSSPLQQSHCLRVFQRGVVRVTGWSGGRGRIAWALRISVGTCYLAINRWPRKHRTAPLQMGTGLQCLQGETLAFFLLRARAFIAVFGLDVPSLRSGWVCVFSVVFHHTRIWVSTPTAIVQLQLQ